MSEHIEISKAGPIVTIRFNRPEKKNAVTGAMYASLTAGMQAAEHDGAVRCVVIAGSGGSFTSGNDLADFRTMTEGDPTFSPFPFIDTLAGYSKPIIAAVEGLAIGIGSTLLLHCDAIFAAPGTRFQFPFTNLGLVPEAGSSLLLPRRIGTSAASELMLFGRPFDEERALALGLINGIVPSGELADFVAAQATILAAKPATALRETKRLLRGDLSELRLRIAEEANIFRERLASPELAEAVAAFREKRTPDFSPYD